MLTLILATGLAIGISAVCSLLESVLYSTRVITLEAAAAAGDAKAEAMRQLKSKIDLPLSAILILNTMANTAGASLAGWAAGQVWGARSLWAFSIVFTLTILLLSEILPKTVGAVYWRWLWPGSVWPLKAMVTALRPLIWVTQSLTNLVTRRKPPTAAVSEAEILAAARLGMHGGEISQMEADLIRNIIALEEVTARDIMTPRTVIFSVDGARTLGDVREEARDWGHTRLPAYLGGVEDVVGYVLKDEVCRLAEQQPDTPLSSLAKPVRFVPATANALNLLGRLLRTRQHMYLVVDEYGGIMGLITLEDLLETLVGTEIVDEKDRWADLQELARRRGEAVLKASEEDGDA